MTEAIVAIQETVAAYYGLTRGALLSKQRIRRIVRPRQIAMRLCTELTDRSLPDIGKRFGNMDHTTVMHACKRITKLLEEKDTVRQEWIALRHACAKLMEVTQAKRIREAVAFRLANPDVESTVPVAPPPAEAPRPTLPTGPLVKPQEPPHGAQRAEIAAYWRDFCAWRRSRIRYPASHKEPAHV